MRRVSGVETDWGWRPLGTRPEALSRIRDRVHREVEQQLLDIVVEIFLKLRAGPMNAIVESLRAVLDNCIINILQSRGLGGRLLLKLLDEIRSREIRIDVFCCRSEQPLEGVPRPLNCVFDGIGEILESADGDGFLGGISGGSIRLGLEWRYYLYIPFCPKGSRLHQRLSVVHTLGIHIQPGLHVVQSIGDAIHLLPESVIKSPFSFWGHFILHGPHIQSRVHALCLLCGNGTLRGLDVVVAEEKLAGQIALFDLIHVGYNNGAFGGAAHPHHGKILDELTSQSTSTYQEIGVLQQHLLHLFAEHCNLPIVPRACRAAIFFGGQRIWQCLNGIKIHKLVER
mmetsp:Transcript_30594/g.51716  ORF Transcript_30594/g.51716 Transcript_30594/m.51716 type:complete len:341 (-) Transcript_30594:1202-2224(-)